VLIDRMRMLQPEVVDCPLIYDLYELIDLLGIDRPPREEPAELPA
jgi:hypothetical protein